MPASLERLLPGAAAVAEARDDESPADLFPAEEAIVAGAVETRRREFAGGRACAHRALERLGLAAAPVLSGERGQPLWPEGVVGSITHCDGYRGCAVGRTTELSTIGVDAEPHAPLPARVLGRVAGAEEAEALSELARAEPAVHWDRLLFSAKEASYKAWYPLAGRWLGFADSVLTFDPGARTFAARLPGPGPAERGAEPRGFEGRWLVADGLVLTAVAVSA